jgi:hypothetical protein
MNSRNSFLIQLQAQTQLFPLLPHPLLKPLPLDVIIGNAQEGKIFSSLSHSTLILIPLDNRILPKKAAAPPSPDKEKPQRKRPNAARRYSFPSHSCFLMLFSVMNLLRREQYTTVKTTMNVVTLLLLLPSQRPKRKKGKFSHLTK